MSRIIIIAVLLLIVGGGVVHGIFTHRWNQWSEDDLKHAVAQIDQIPLEVGDWTGERVEADLQTKQLIQELFGIGRGVTIRYVHRTDRITVSVYFARGPTAALIGHNPLACYTAHGYESIPPNIRFRPLDEGAADEQQFWVANFAKKDTPGDNLIRVFWSWSDGHGWRVPDNPLRAFRRTPIIDKVYFIRGLTNANEPVDGDPAVRLMAALLPKIPRTPIRE